jgi:hypothetical protein
VTAPEIEDDDENEDDRRGEESILANEVIEPGTKAFFRLSSVSGPGL